MDTQISEENLQALALIKDWQSLRDDHLKTDRDFWDNVQEPSKRIKDMHLLAKLAYIAVHIYTDVLIQTSATIVLIYRSLEDDLALPFSDDDLIETSKRLQSKLDPSSGFGECRWYMSLCLATTAKFLKLKRIDDSLNILSSTFNQFETALYHGQLFTNLVKANLLSLCAIAGKEDSKYSLYAIDIANRILACAPVVPKNYKFSNQYAFEEVAYVYAMIRQIYNWLSIHKNNPRQSLLDFQKAGFDFNYIGHPFKEIIKESLVNETISH